MQEKVSTNRVHLASVLQNHLQFWGSLLPIPVPGNTHNVTSRFGTSGFLRTVHCIESVTREPTSRRGPVRLWVGPRVPCCGLLIQPTSWPTHQRTLQSWTEVDSHGNNAFIVFGVRLTQAFNCIVLLQSQSRIGLVCFTNFLDLLLSSKQANLPKSWNFIYICYSTFFTNHFNDCEQVQFCVESLGNSKYFKDEMFYRSPKVQKIANIQKQKLKE